MSGIFQYQSGDSQAAQNIGATTSPDPGSVNGQLMTLRGLVDGVEATLGDATATPPANSVSDRLLSLVSSLAIAASPTANSVQARLQSIADFASTISSAIGTIASPVANSLQARLQSIVDSASNIASAVGTVASPAANTLQSRIQGVLDAIGTISSPAAGTLLNLVTSLQTRLGSTGDAQATSDTGSFSAIAMLKLIAARIKLLNDNEQITSSNPVTQTISSSTTTASWGSAVGKGFRIVASTSNPGKILIRVGGAPSATLFSYELYPGQTLFEDAKITGFIQTILPSGSAAHTANVTIFS